MKKFLYPLMAFLFAVFSIVLSSCSDDSDEEVITSINSITCKGKEYVGEDGTCDILYSTKIEFCLNEKGDKSLISYKYVNASIYFDPFDPEKTPNGTTFEVTSAYLDYSIAKLEGIFNCNKNVSGTVTFVSYDSSSKIIVFKINNLKGENKNGEKLIFNGTVRCEVVRISPQ